MTSSRASLSVLFGCAALFLGCSSSSSAPTSPTSNEITEADAKSRATVLVGNGTAESTSKIENEEEHRWRVDVRLAGGALVFVELERASGTLAEMGGEQGPFDYEIAGPAAGFLTYGQAKTRALAAKQGQVEAWEVKPDETQYEFYVRDADTKLWEIKMNAQKGDITSTVEKAERD